MYRDILGFSITSFMQRVMTVNGFFASIMRTGKKSEDSDGNLPPGVPIPVLLVDYLKVKPDNWIGGEGSYVCPIDSDWGLWFNWSMNNLDNAAVLPSVKGMNPLTGQRVSGYGLEQYQDECPVHKKPFSKGMLCTECGFKWPAQNYISKPNKFYLDGFRMPDGNVRQFYFTEEMALSVPEQVIGKEDTVPAFGFCFYKLKNFKPNWEEGNHIKNKFPKDTGNNDFIVASIGYRAPDTDLSSYRGGVGLSGLGSPVTFGATMDSYSPGIYCVSKSSESTDEIAKAGRLSERSLRMKSSSVDMKSPIIGESLCCFSASASVSNSDTREYASPALDAAYLEAPVRKSAEVGVGAGAKIKQSFEKSKHAVEDWESKPAGVIRIYFVFQEEFEKYASAGFNNLEGNESGYLEGITVGGSNE